MSFENNIKNKLSHLKPTVTKVYSSTGTVMNEIRDNAGNVYITNVGISSPGYIVDNTPDLSVSFILPWLCMGSQDVAHDHSLLKSRKIKHILSVGIHCPHYDDITTTFVKVYDLEEFRIDSIFEKCNRVIDSVRIADEIIYVHCNAGVSRSATVVAAYLVQFHKIDHLKALEMIKRVRPKVNPNRGFVKQLEQYARQVNRQTNHY